MDNNESGSGSNQSLDYKLVRLDVSIILPAYNEEKAIRKVLSDVQAAMEGTNYGYEIIVVDDFSTDRTVELAQEFPVRIIRRAKNGGSGATRKTGIQYARGDIVVMLDTDDSYSAEDIPLMLSYFPEYDQVNGARTSEEGTMPWLRGPAKWLLRKIAVFLTNYPIPDLNTGLKAFKRNIMINYLWVIPDGFSCVTAMTLAFITNGHFIKYIPTTYKKRVGESKFHPLRDTYNYLLTIYRMILYFHPMKAFSLIFWFLAVFGLTRTLVNRIFLGYMLMGDIVILLSAGLVLIIGLLAELLIASTRQATFQNIANTVKTFERDVQIGAKKAWPSGDDK
jgi:glycosyltransferase involved in cell wall biosynthesis